LRFAVKPAFISLLDWLYSISREDPFMPAYAVVIREKTRNAEKLGEYKKMAPASFQKHPAKFLALHGRSEVLEGPQSEEIIILEFPSYEAAQAWYHSAEYQAACEHRFQGGDYRCIITEGTAAK
jgi:uncharacterized protein (DUF1330 family)